MSAPKIFTEEYYERMRELEEASWWNAGVRDTAVLFLDRVELPERGKLLDRKLLRPLPPAPDPVPLLLDPPAGVGAHPEVRDPGHERILAAAGRAAERLATPPEGPPAAGADPEVGAVPHEGVHLTSGSRGRRPLEPSTASGGEGTDVADEKGGTHRLVALPPS